MPLQAASDGVFAALLDKLPIGVLVLRSERMIYANKTLLDLLDRLKCGPRDILRDKGTPAGELGLLDPAVDNARILDAMVAHPILVNRPIVVTPLGARLARPSEIVCDSLARKPGRFTKEDGQTVEPR